MTILDKEIQDSSLGWEDFRHRLPEAPPDGHVAMECRWLRDGEGRMMAVWAPEQASR